MNKINVGIIGTGGIGRMHAEGITEEQETMRLIAACDVNSDALIRFSDEFHIDQRYTDYRGLLQQNEVDAVVVLAPHDLHEEICVAASRQGKHVLVEKPISRTLHEADRIIEAAEASGCILMVGFNQRYMSRYRKIHRLVSEGAIGEIMSIRIDHHQDFSVSAESWWRSKETVGGGCVIGSGIHRLDLLRMFLGEPEELFAFGIGDQSRLEAEATVTASIRFRGGAIADFFCNWAVPFAWHDKTKHFFEEGMTLFGTNGAIHTRADETLFVQKNGHSKNNAVKPIQIEEAEFESMWAHFARCIRTNITPDTSGQDGRKSLEVVIAIYSSMETGKPVSLPLNQKN